MNRQMWIGLFLVLMLGVSAAAYAQVIRQAAPAASVGPYQFLVRPQAQDAPAGRAFMLNPEAASLYRCNTVTGEVEILVETSENPKQPSYRWWRVSIRDN